MTKLSQEQFYTEIGKRIKDFRERADISQETLAAALGLTRASVMNVEKGRHKPSLFQLIEIADILKVSLNSLIPRIEIHSKEEGNDFFKIGFENIISDQEEIDEKTEASVLKFYKDYITNK